MKMAVLRSVTGAPLISAQYNHSHSSVRNDPGAAVSFTSPPRPVALNAGKPSVCTADELHYVPVSNSDWKLALWRYTASPTAPRRNRPLLLLSGVGTNAIGYDLSPEFSFARSMSVQGFDTWVLEVRGAGLSSEIVDSEEVVPTMNEFQSAMSSGQSAEYETTSKGKSLKIISQRDPTITPKFVEGPLNLFNRFSGFFRVEFTTIVNTLKALRREVKKLVKRQESVPPQFSEFQQYFVNTLEDYENQLDMLMKYDWDFDHYLEEDVPAAMEYIRTHCKSRDRKMLAVGHSMGGILLYAMLSRYGLEGKDSDLAAIVTLGSSLDYTSSSSSLKLLLPLADPAQALKVPAIPLGALLAAAHPFASRPPYILSGLTAQITAQNLHPELMEKFVFNNFGTVPAKVLLQLTTAFRKGGLCDRSRSVYYKDHICKTNVPVLAIAGDRDLICPPEAVFETAKLVPEHLLEYKVFGEPSGPHYAHYDLVGGVSAPNHVYPCIINFLSRHDKICA